MHVPHEAFRLVFAGNTVGQGDTTGAFSGVGVQNTATIDRFTTSIELGYLDTEHEVSILTSKLAVEASTARNMVQVAGLIRNAYQQGKIGLTMSPRTLLSWGKKLTRYNPSTAFEVSYACKLVADDKQAAQEFFTKVFG
jgi:MoxR-like ATPase